MVVLNAFRMLIPDDLCKPSTDDFCYGARGDREAGEQLRSGVARNAVGVGEVVQGLCGRY